MQFGLDEGAIVLTCPYEFTLLALTVLASNLFILGPTDVKV